MHTRTVLSLHNFIGAEKPRKGEGKKNTKKTMYLITDQSAAFHVIR